MAEATLTIDGTLPDSLSGVMAIDCTRNLSLHLASSGGSSFIAWSRTGQAISMDISLVCEYRRTLNFDFMTRLNAPRIWSHAILFWCRGFDLRFFQ